MTDLLVFSQFWSCFFSAVFFFTFFQSKYPTRRTAAILFSTSAVLLVTGFSIYTLLGAEHIAAITLLTCSIPSLILFILLSEYRDGRFFFTFCLCDTACIWLMQFTNLLGRLCGEMDVMLFVSRLLLFPLMEFLAWKLCRHPYLELQAHLPGGWWTITAISAGFYLLLMIVSIPSDIPVGANMETAIMTLVMFLVPVTYFTILGSLHRQMLYYETQSKRDILAAQVTGMEGRVTATLAAEEALRIERHDLRYKLLAVEDMIRRGEAKEALDYIHTLQGEVEYAKPEKWCTEPLLDAVFSAYFAQARQQGIRVKAKLAFPEKLPVDAAELCTVFANALDNAIRACALLPEERRELVCTCISHPSLMFEIANPYQGTIRFDQAGRPVAQTSDHGIGTRSISAFCEKHDAYCLYEAKDGWFHLKIAM